MGDDERINSYIKHYVIPFIDRYKANPYLWCVDICNEIEWMHENSECGNIPWERLQYFAAGVFTQNASGRNELVVPISEAYIKTYQNGWKGLMVWTSNGVDGNGTLTDCGPGLSAFNLLIDYL